MRPLLLLLVSTALLTANPPRYAITARTLHSGGTMTGGSGRFTLTATAGQPEAAPAFSSSDARYTLAPGFWPAVVILTAPGSPPLHFLPAAPGTALLAWPVETTGWHLEQSADLITWTPVELPLINTPAHHTVTVPTTGIARRFFRLGCP